jgi:hypothetical protein
MEMSVVDLPAASVKRVDATPEEESSRQEN